MAPSELPTDPGQIDEMRNNPCCAAKNPRLGNSPRIFQVHLASDERNSGAKDTENQAEKVKAQGRLGRFFCPAGGARSRTRLLEATHFPAACEKWVRSPWVISSSRCLLRWFSWDRPSSAATASREAWAFLPVRPPWERCPVYPR